MREGRPQKRLLVNYALGYAVPVTHRGHFTIGQGPHIFNSVTVMNLFKSPSKITPTVDEATKQVKITINSSRFNYDLVQDFKAAYLDHAGSQKYCIDLSKVTYIDSSAMGMLLVMKGRTRCEYKRDQSGKLLYAG